MIKLISGPANKDKGHSDIPISGECETTIIM